jgi:hypothetical protein
VVRALPAVCLPGAWCLTCEHRLTCLFPRGAARADMAGCKSSLTGDDFYGQYDAQDMAKKHATELGMQVRALAVRASLARHRG